MPTSLQDYGYDMSASFADADIMQNLPMATDPMPPMVTSEPEMRPELVSPVLQSNTHILARHGVSYRVAMSHASSYFLHFQPFLPIVHRPTFSINTTQPALVSIVVAIGRFYSPQPDGASPSRYLSDALWDSGIEELEGHVSLPFDLQ